MLAMLVSLFFFFNDTATTEIYTLSLHDALPILDRSFVLSVWEGDLRAHQPSGRFRGASPPRPISFGCCSDRKSTRLNSSHANISYAVFCLKKKKYNI